MPSGTYYAHYYASIIGGSLPMLPRNQDGIVKEAGFGVIVLVRKAQTFNIEESIAPN